MTRPAPKELRRVALTPLITPSRIDPWRAGRREGERFTAAQLARLADRGLDPETVPVIEVRSTATAREMWWPTGDPAPVFIFECPVIGDAISKRTGERRVKVIAPAGSTRLVWPDGSIKRTTPRRYRRHA